MFEWYRFATSLISYVTVITRMEICGLSSLLTYYDKVAIHIRIFLVIEAHMFDSGAGQNSSQTNPIRMYFIKSVCNYYKFQKQKLVSKGKLCKCPLKPQM